MRDLLQQLSKNRFVIIGRAGMDIYPDPPGTKSEDASHFVSGLGGSSANVGVAITKLGGSASLVTCVSDDAVGRYCLNQLDHYGVERDHVRSIKGQVRTSLAVVESRLEDHQSVIYRNNAADFQMNENDIRAINYADFCALIITGTTLAAEPSRSSCFSAIDLARQAGLPIIIDIDHRPYSWGSDQEAAEVYKRAAGLSDIVIGNDDEFAVMAGGMDEGLTLAKALAECGVSIVIYKLGERGSMTFTSEGDRIGTGVFQVTALKPTGAGDSFLGALIASLAAEVPLKEAILRGSAAAALVVTRVGCAPAMPFEDDLSAFMDQHSGPSGGPFEQP